LPGLDPGIALAVAVGVDDQRRPALRLRRIAGFPEQLGIDPEKEGEVYECGPENSLRLYGGWFYFAGELTGPDERVTDSNSDFQYWFADAKQYPAPAVDFGKSVMSLQFVTKLPWIISDQR